MKISDKNKNILYGAIADKIMDTRLEIAKLTLAMDYRKTIDDKLFDLQHSIWKEIKLRLKIED